MKPRTLNIGEIYWISKYHFELKDGVLDVRLDSITRGAYPMRLIHLFDSDHMGAFPMAVVESCLDPRIQTIRRSEDGFPYLVRKDYLHPTEKEAIRASVADQVDALESQVKFVKASLVGLNGDLEGYFNEGSSVIWDDLMDDNRNLHEMWLARKREIQREMAETQDLGPLTPYPAK